MLAPVKSADRSKEPECRTCKHAYITYEASFPHGCRLFGFKSASPPSVVVFESTGQSCGGYEKRPTQGPASKPGDWKA
jgi:hypothetical protein